MKWIKKRWKKLTGIIFSLSAATSGMYYGAEILSVDDIPTKEIITVDEISNIAWTDLITDYEFYNEDGSFDEKVDAIRVGIKKDKVKDLKNIVPKFKKELAEKNTTKERYYEDQDGQIHAMIFHKGAFKKESDGWYEVDYKTVKKKNYDKQVLSGLDRFFALAFNASYADTVNSSTADGVVYYQNSNWSTVRNATTGSSANSSGTTDAQGIAAYYTTTKQIRRSFFYFDVSGLAGTASAASVNIDGGTIQNEAEACILQETQPSLTPKQLPVKLS